MSIKNNRISHGTTGQAMVELCLCLPFLLLAMVSIFFLGKMFHTRQVICYAAQQGARVARKLPDLNSPETQEQVTGFCQSGQRVNSTAIVYRVLESGGLLTDDGDLPPGAKIRIVAFDDSSNKALVPETLSVQIEYPFSILPKEQQHGSGATRFGIPIAAPATPTSPTLWFGDCTIKFEATTPAEMHQEGG